MKVLVIGGGGREHAIVWKLSQSRHVDRIYCCPGNAGISEIAECINIDPYNSEGLVDFVKYEWIDLTIASLEESLYQGVVDLFEKEGRRILGPNKAAAAIGMSRSFAKDLMRLYRIPTAEYKVFTSYLHAEDYLRLKGVPMVIKADQPTEPDGVFIAKHVEEAKEALRMLMKEKTFGDLSKRVILEKHIEGDEVSFMVLADGRTTVPLEASKNYKRMFDGDRGPATQGMGAYSPVSFFTKKQESTVMEKIIHPLLKALNLEGIRYRGVLSVDILFHNGNPYVLELNCSFGDPEIQAVLPRLKTDFMDIALAITDRRLSDIQHKIEWNQGASVCIVASSGGYPGSYQEGLVISGLEQLKEMKDVHAFHLNTAYLNTDFVTSGGRVLSITATGLTLKDGRAKAYRVIEKMHFEGIHYRKDIGI